MNKYRGHQNLLNETTLYLQKEFPNARFYSRHVGLFYSSRIFHAIKEIYSIEGLKQWLYAAKSKYIVKINQPGMPDQYAIIPVEVNGKMLPIHFEIEYKSNSGRLSKDQKKWKTIYESMGVKFIEARNKEAVLSEIKDHIEWIKS